MVFSQGPLQCSVKVARVSERREWESISSTCSPGSLSRTDDKRMVNSIFPARFVSGETACGGRENERIKLLVARVSYFVVETRLPRLHQTRPTPNGKQ